MKKAVVALVAAAVVTAGALNISGTASAKTVSGADYSRAGYSYVSINAADFMEILLNQNISAAEREYLNAHSDFALKYNDKVAGKNVKSEYVQATGEITVTPSPFSYVAANGRTVTWEPVSVNGGQFDGVWKGVIAGDYAEDYVSVRYETSFSVPYGEVNGIVNAYHDVAKAAFEKLTLKKAEYDEAYAEYVVKLEEYRKYLKDNEKYKNDLAAYNDYVVKLRDWTVKNNLYQNYLKEYAQYEDDQKAYEDYQKALAEYLEKESLYRQYLTDKENYDKLYAEYQEKINDPRIAKELGHIAILDYIFTPVVINGNNPRTLYSAVMGNSVTQVLSRLGEVTDSALSLAKLVRKPITDAEKATKNLRDIFSKLNDCKTDEDKYSLYISTYESLRSNLNVLLQSLEYCFRNDFVRSQIQSYEGNNRELQFQIMLAQLYTVCNAIDDNVIGSYYKEHMSPYDQRNNPAQMYDFDGSYLIGGKGGIAPATLLAKYGGTMLPDSNDGKPIDVYVPIPEEPVEPEEVEKPVQPQRVQQPVAPEEVENPGPAPDEVADPGAAPDEVKQPVEPVEYQPTAEEQALADDYNGGGVVPRKELTANYVYHAECYVEHYFRNAQLLTVAFYLNENDAVPEWEEEDVQTGSSVEYGGRTPQMTRRGHTCEFAGWKNSEGEIVDINALPPANGYLKLYPYFTETANTYPVIWIVDGVEYRAEAAYGTIPNYNDICAGAPAKSNDADGREYRFTGWNTAIVEMSDGPAYYTAQFERSFLITFKVNSESCVVSVWKGELPVYTGAEPRKDATSRYYYTFDGWGKEVVAAQKDATYTAQFANHAILDLGSGAAEITLTDGTYYADCRLAAIKAFDITYLAGLAAQNGAGLNFRMSAYTITFSAAETYMLNQSGGGTLVSSISQFNTTSSGYGSYRYSVSITDSTRSSYGGTFTMTAVGYIDSVHSRLFRIDGDEKTEMRYTYGGNSVTFSMRAGYVYEIYPQYAVNILASADVTLSASANTASENDIITVTLGEPAIGKYVEKLYVLDADGNEIELAEDRTFTMPEGDVSIGATCGFVEFTVVFKADGVVIATRTYHYGDTVEPPQAFKSPDGEYSYTFIGWDKEVVPVTENAEYNAVFAAEPLPEPDAAPLSKKMQIVIWIANHLVLIIVVAAVLFVLFVTGIILIVRHRRKKKKLDKVP